MVEPLLATLLAAAEVFAVAELEQLPGDFVPLVIIMVLTTCNVFYLIIP